MKLRTVLCISFLFSALFSFSQKGVYRDKFTEGNLLLEEKNYPQAMKNFQEAYAIDSINANINYKMGFCYLMSSAEKTKAVPYLEKAVNKLSSKYDPYDPMEKSAPLQAYYALAQAYQLNYRFNDAITFFNKYKDGTGGRSKEVTKDVDRRIETCYNAIEFAKQPGNVVITNLGDSVNSPYPDYGPVITADESQLIFTSRRIRGVSSETMIDGSFFEDIYICYKLADGSWSSPYLLDVNVNTKDNEASIGLSADGQQLFIYKDDLGDGNIYYSNLDGDRWSSPQKLGSDINLKSWEPSACLSADGNTIYFVSDRKGGFGGRDIWRCVRLPNGNWSLASNLGPAINTEYDEDAPFIHPDRVTLFFSSNGHKSMGGFDVFFSALNEEGKWSEPTNIGMPINTPDDDIFYVTSTDGKRAYYSSVRPDGKGEKDIYMVSSKDASVVEGVTLLKGRLTFNGTDKIPADVKITAIDVETGETVQEVKPNSKNGKYILVLSPGKNGKKYVIHYEAEGFQPIEQTIVVEPHSAYREIEAALDLKGINFESKTLGTIAVTGWVRNKEGVPVPGARITVKDNTTGKLVDTYYTEADSGTYYFVLQRGQNYNLSYEADMYLFQSENVNVPKQPEYSQLDKNITLEKVKVGTKVILRNVFFDSNKSTLRKESTVELDNVIKVMKDYPDVKIEVSGHTDNKGQDAINLKLSQARAQAVVDYLVKKGIDRKRLTAKGYGKTQPVAPNTLKNGKPDLKGMQMNRRVEMKIIE